MSHKAHDVTLCDIFSSCINLILHRLEGCPDHMHYEIINCTLVIGISIGIKLEYTNMIHRQIRMLRLESRERDGKTRRIPQLRVSRADKRQIARDGDK